MSKIIPLSVVLMILSASSGCLTKEATSKSTTSVPQSSPSTMAASASSVAEIRAMIKDAIALKSDPQKAQAMMIRACELVAQLPPGSDYKGLAVDFNPDKREIDHLMQPTSTKVLEKKNQLSPHIELCEKSTSNTYPFVGMADNGKGFIFPKMTTDSVLTEQNLKKGDKIIFSVVWDPHKDTRWKKYYVSPDEKYVILEDWLNAKPTEVLNIEIGKTVAVDAPEIDGHHNVYPFSFVTWNKDSVSFIVEVNGTYVKGPGEMLAYRELWQVAADSGKTKQVKRQEQPWDKKLKWAD